MRQTSIEHKAVIITLLVFWIVAIFRSSHSILLELSGGECSYTC